MKQPKLTMTTWDGDRPLPGQYLMTKNGRTAYLVLDVIVAKAQQKFAFKVMVERRPRDILRPDDVVHWFQWNRRS